MSYSYENENNSVNGIRNTEAALGRCSVERHDTPDRHPATVTKTTKETKRGGKRNKNKKIARKIGTWNVRTLLQPGKLASVTKEMERVQIDILGLAETRWRNSGTKQYGDYTYRNVCWLVLQAANVRSVTSFVDPLLASIRFNVLRTRRQREETMLLTVL